MFFVQLVGRLWYMSKPIATDMSTVHMVWSASVIDFMMSNCVHFGTYMPDISRDILLSSKKDNVSLLTFMLYYI
jgi:hypothetical protein